MTLGFNTYVIVIQQINTYNTTNVNEAAPSPRAGIGHDDQLCVMYVFVIQFYDV